MEVIYLQKYVNIKHYVTLQTLFYDFRNNVNIVGADAYINQPFVNIDAHQPDFTIIVYNTGRCGHRPLQNTLIQNNLWRITALQAIALDLYSSLE